MSEEDGPSQRPEGPVETPEGEGSALAPRQSLRMRRRRRDDRGDVEGEWGGGAPTRFSRVAVWCGLTTVIVLVAGGWLVSRGNKEATAQGEIGAGIARENIAGEGPREVAKRFLEAGSLEERLVWTRLQPDLESRIPAFAEEARAFPVPYKEMDPLGVVRVPGGLSFRRFTIHMREGGRRLLCVVSTEDGWKVDWEAFARHSSKTWDELHTGETTEAEVRVFARRGAHYQGAFRDDKIWCCFMLTSPDWPESLYGYARRDSTTTAVLASATAKKGAAQRVTLLITGVEEGDPRQVAIRKALALGWVVSDVDPEWIRERLR